MAQIGEREGAPFEVRPDTMPNVEVPEPASVPEPAKTEPVPA